MPIYEFYCSQCECNFEELMTGSATDVTCPDCNSAKVTKKMSTCAHKSGGTFRSSHSCSCGNCSSGSCGCTNCSCH